MASDKLNDEEGDEYLKQIIDSLLDEHKVNIQRLVSSKWGGNASDKQVNKVKEPKEVTPYILFSADRKLEIAKEFPSMTASEIKKKADVDWKQYSDKKTIHPIFAKYKLIADKENHDFEERLVKFRLDFPLAAKEMSESEKLKAAQPDKYVYNPKTLHYVLIKKTTDEKKATVKKQQKEKVESDASEISDNSCSEEDEEEEQFKSNNKTTLYCSDISDSEEEEEVVVKKAVKKVVKTVKKVVESEVEVEEL